MSLVNVKLVYVEPAALKQFIKDNATARLVSWPYTPADRNVFRFYIYN